MKRFSALRPACSRGSGGARGRSPWAAPVLALFVAAGTASGQTVPGTAELPEPPADDGKVRGHERMLALLGEIARKTPEESPFLGQRKLKALRAQYRSVMAQTEPNPIDRWRVNFELGQSELTLGMEEKAIEHLRAACELIPTTDFSKGTGGKEVEDVNTYYANTTRLQLGMAYLRRGETQNCCLRHTGESCILPIRGAGVHRVQEGSRDAIACFTEVLEHRPAKPERIETIQCQKAAQWLLNIAYMTLGEYPGAVPEEYLVDLDELMPCSIDFPRFENVLPRLDLDTFDLSGGAIVDDFDGDDYLDIVTTCWDTQGQTRFFRNQGDGTFVEKTKEAGLTGFFGGLNAVQADYDNDGDIDFFVLRGAWMKAYGVPHLNSLLQNDGRGRFRDVTFEAGLASPHYPTKTGAWADYDLDGDLDLYVGAECSDEVPDAMGQLYQNQGDGTFVDVAEKGGLAEHLFANGCVWGDYDGDRYPDLLVSTGFPDPARSHEGGAPEKLYHNNGDGTFTDVGPQVGVVEPMASFPCWFWDFDQDGALDIYVACSSGPIAVLADPRIRFGLNCLYRGDGRGGFREVAKSVGLDYPAQTMGANFGDLNGDGYPDFYLSTGNIQLQELHPNVMFLNMGGERFENVTLKGGLGHLQKGHGVSFADIDNDGDEDVFVQMGGARPGDKFQDALFENPGFGNHWLTVELEGVRSNRCAIGARIRAEIEEDGKLRSVYRHVNSGGSFGCNPLRQTLGLGRAASVRALEVFWPVTGETQRFEDFQVDRAVRIVEDQDRLAPIELRVLRLGG